jgi:uncharacterized repeat protein (TIGR01451 family)
MEGKMRVFPKLNLLSLFFVCVLAIGVTQTANAVGTVSGTNVENFATVDYQVGGFDQAQIFSDTAAFLVDNKVDLTVATVDVAAVIVVPGDTMRVLTFTLANTGNTTQDYSFTAAAATGTLFGVTDNFDATNVMVYVDANANDTYDPGVDVATYADELAADDTVTVFIVADIPLVQVDGDGALYDLIAQTAQGGAPASQGADILTDDGGAIDDPAVVQIVFADGAGTADGIYDGQHSSRDVYVVGSALLTVTKSSAVISDPFNGVTNPKAIPGARIHYTIDVTNTGSAAANTVVLSDEIPANTTYANGSVTTSNSNGSATTLVEYSADGTNWFPGETSPVAFVRVTNSVIDATAGTAQVTFDVIIN